jgi:hypothetical protein
MSFIKTRTLALILATAALAAPACTHDGASSGDTSTTVPASCKAELPGARLLRRLSRAEYDATIHDLFGIDSTWGDKLTPDVVVDGFDNNASALVVSPLLADQPRKSAEQIAAEVMKDPSKILPCQVANGDAACAEKFVDGLGKRAFRRPLTDTERTRYVGLYTSVAADDGFATGVETVISALLQSPSFLYRTEIGDGAAGSSADTVRLTPYEIASELSYFLWGTMPDDALFAAAAAGALDTPEGLEKEARRLVADPRADAVIARFVEAWLEIDRLATIPKDAATYPGFDDGVRAAMREETRRFVTHVVREGTGALPELFTAEYTFASADLAKLYALPAPAGADASGFGEVDLGGTARAGLLTQGSVLATHARPNSSSPIHRGKLVRERLFCQTMPPPPPGLNVEPPPLDPSLTTRERYAVHATKQPCKSCHTLIDPIGFGFERFDGIGRYREKENGKEIDASGEISSTPGTNGTFDGVRDLGQKLAESDDVKACFARQWVRFAYGVKDEGDMECTAAKAGAEFAQGDLRVDELLVSLVKRAYFVERKRDGNEGGGTGGSGGAGGSGATTSAGAGGMDAGSPVDPGLDVKTTVDSQWDTGYQETVTITNTSGAPITWTVTLPVGGMIQNIWNADATPSGAQTSFKGKDYNAVLAPAATTSFGFIVAK